MYLHVRNALTAAALPCVVCALIISASAQITVTSPTNGSTVPMPVWVRAHNAGCNGNSPNAFGYSIGSSPFITWGITDLDIDATDYRMNSPGTYTVHFKGWANGTLCPVVDSNVTVNGPASTNDDQIDADTNWLWVHDTGTGGTATGTTTYPVASPAQDGHSRKFTMSYTSGGGMRGSTSFATDQAATHFVYDAYVYLTDPASVLNVEMDTNQVWDANGDVLIFGLQCAGATGFWQYTTNVSGKTHWNNTTLACNPQNWTANTWHHVQLAVHRDGSGNAFYDSIIFDGKTTNLSGVNGNSSFSLGWSPPGNLVLNFQIDGKGASGSITAYVDGLTEIYW